MADHEVESRYMIEQKHLMTFPYAWTSQYHAGDVEVFHDAGSSMPYVKVRGRKMFFPARYHDKYVQKYFNSILMEQDPRSAHFYFDPEKEDLDDGIFFDVGGAEGYVSLEVVPYVSKLVIFECDEDWIEALNATFEPWREKVQIVNRFASSKNDKNEVRIDAFEAHEQKVFIKIDVEGTEKEVLMGADKLLMSENVQVYVCTYHKKNDEQDLSEFLSERGFEIEKSDGYMFYGLGKDAGFRRGVIRGKRVRGRNDGNQ